jgi:hypothetical protein
VFATLATKVSAGALLGVGFGWAALRRPGGPRIAFLAAMAAAGLLALYWFQPRTGRALAESFEPLSFFRHLDSMHWRGAVMTLILPGAYLGAMLWRRRLERFGEVVLVMTLLALVPGFLLRLWASTAWWFWNTMHWVAVPLIASSELPRGRIGRALAGASVVCVVALALARIDVTPIVAVAAQLPPPAAGMSVRDFAREWFTDCGTRFAGPIADRLRDGEGARLLAAVSAVAPADRRGVAIFVPPSNRAFWNMEEPWACRRRPSYVPALTGLPLLKGAGPSCPLWVTTLDNSWSELDGTAVTVASDDAELCRHGRDRGVRTVVILESTTEPAKNRVLTCAGEGTEGAHPVDVPGGIG